MKRCPTADLRASDNETMSNDLLSILNNSAVLERTSATTRRVLEERAKPASSERFLTPELYTLLQQITATMLPQESIGTDVDIAAGIDQRLLEGTNAGWRFADLPEDGEAYKRGLTVFAAMLQQTPMKVFDLMPPPAREGYLRCVANGDVDGPAQFPLSRWLGMLRTDAVKFWMAHPSTMEKIEYYGFADGASGATDGPTQTEGWSAITSNKALPFEQGITMPEIITGREA
jgi:hypothetical protein